MIRFCLVLAIVAFLSPPALSEDIAFTVTMPRPTTHLLQVKMQVPAKLGRVVNLVLPVWTPGSYLVREYSRHVMGFRVADANGRPLPWEKTSKNIWRIQNRGNGGFTAQYQVYANELSVRTAILDDKHAFWNNAAVLMFVQNKLNTPVTVSVEPFGAWKVATSLEPLRTPNLFRAPDFDTLYDSPILAGDLNILPFKVREIAHRIVIDGRGNYTARIKTDVAKIVETEAAMMGGLPYSNYTFFPPVAADRGRWPGAQERGVAHLRGAKLRYTRRISQFPDAYLA